MVEGKIRKLVFKVITSLPQHSVYLVQDTHLEDAGEITCKTNRDSSSCLLKVSCKESNGYFPFSSGSILTLNFFCQTTMGLCEVLNSL